MKKVLLASAIITATMASCSKSNDVLPAGTTTTTSGTNTNNTNGTNNSGGNGNNNGGGNTASKESQMGYQLITVNRSASVAQKSTAGMSINWTGGTANPVLVKFESKKDGVETEYKTTINTQVDLMALLAAGFGNYTIPNGTYSEIELKIELEKNGNNPALQLQGTITKDALTIPVKITVDEALELKTEQENITVTDSTIFTAITSINLSAITDGIKESDILGAKLTNGTLLISADDNKDLYKDILDNLKKLSHHCEIEKKHK